ncbi:MAG: hypothetical protein K1X67_17505 [Fimbriimonadaceae bacterium]|nr:hypothetical protein [Fimbriimonadaceae bacterium]
MSEKGKTLKQELVDLLERSRTLSDANASPSSLLQQQEAMANAVEAFMRRIVTDSALPPLNLDEEIERRKREMTPEEFADWLSESYPRLVLLESLVRANLLIQPDAKD